MPIRITLWGDGDFGQPRAIKECAIADKVEFVKHKARPPFQSFHRAENQVVIARLSSVVCAPFLTGSTISGDSMGTAFALLRKNARDDDFRRDFRDEKPAPAPEEIFSVY